MKEDIASTEMPIGGIREGVFYVYTALVEKNWPNLREIRIFLARWLDRTGIKVVELSFEGRGKSSNEASRKRNLV